MSTQTKQKRSVGRPSKKDDDGFGPVSKLLAAFWRGCNVTEACNYADISRETYYKWTSENPELTDTFAMARTKVSENAKAIIVNAIDNGDINAAKWWLERRNKKEFGPNADDNFEEPSNEELAEAKLQAVINEAIAEKYRIYLFHKREILLAEYTKQNEYLVSRIDRLIKLPDQELADYAYLEIKATGIDYAGVERWITARFGGENYKDISKMLEETKQQYEAWQEAQETKQPAAEPNPGISQVIA